jgi:hypothetical protein
MSDYTILNTANGETFSMNFSSKTQLVEWLAETGWTCLGPTENYLPTRHERMKNKDEDFAGWGS